jgi:CheY-like chemotaxis protein
VRKRALIAEQSDVIRGVAESILRQNGYEVISVPTAEKAREVLQMTRPDIMIVGGDLKGVDGRPLYERVQADMRTASIPLLLFRNSDDGSLPFPDEVLIDRPFDPRDFMERVSVFTGQGQQASPTSADNPIASDLDDEFLDAALGMDRINVTDSQVMDKTVVGSRKNQKKPTDKLIGIDVEADDVTATGRVEMVTLEDTTTTNNLKRKQSAPPSGGTGKLDILDDQYGMTDHAALKVADTNQAHDYDWFVNEMKQSPAEKNIPAQQLPAAKAATKPSQSGGLEIRTTASYVDPITPAPGATPARADKKKIGVDNFINEFKQEIEKFRSEEPESITITEKSASNKTSGGALQWNEQLERLSPEEMKLFTKQLSRDIAEKVAEKIIAKIDSDKLMVLIKNEILSRSQK